MATFNLRAIQNGISKPITGADDGLIPGLRIGTSGANTLLTKAILDNLVTLQDGSDIADSIHHHDGLYTRTTELASTDATSGAKGIGVNHSAVNHTPSAATVEDHLASLDAALAAAGGVEFNDSTFRIYDNGDATKKIAFEASAITTSTTRTVTMPDADVDLGLVASAIQSSEKASANGVATLDGGGKIPSSQLPSSVMEYKGSWNANTNSPALADGVGDNGDVYLVSVAGTQDLGSGSQTFALGDWVVYNGSIWEKSLNSDSVVSVNGQTGVVSLDSDDISEGSTNLYYTEARFDSSLSGKSTTDLSEGTNLYYTQARFDSAFTAKDTDDLSEGSTNLYHTTARARAAAVADSITDGVTDVAPSQNAVFDALALKADAGALPSDTDDLSEGSVNLYYTDARAKAAAVADSITDAITDVAPSQNAVFDALALKQDASAELDEAETFFAATDISGAEAEQLTDGSNADSLHEHEQLVSSQAYTSATGNSQYELMYIKSDGEIEIANANAEATSLSVIGFTTAAVGAAATTKVIHFGEISPFIESAGSLTVGAEVFLSSVSGGAVTSTAPTAAGTYVVYLGIATSASTFLFTGAQVRFAN